MPIADAARPKRALPRIVAVPIEQLCAHPSNPRVHKPKQIRQISDSIGRFGFTNPILTDGEANILAGHGRLAAAKLLGLKTVPTICLEGLTAAEKRAYIIADNRLGDNSSFDRKLLAQEVPFILETDPDFDIELTGFELNDIEIMLDVGGQVAPKELPVPPPERSQAACCRPGDLWTLGKHKLFYGSALERNSFVRLMGRERARMIFVDPPYNQPAKEITGKGRVSHGDFAMAAGEMTEAEFIAFLTAACTLLAKASVDGALHYVCMDWRHQYELLTAGRAVFHELLNTCVWVKGSPALGALYRSQHEFVAVFKRGKAMNRPNPLPPRSNLLPVNGVRKAARFLSSSPTPLSAMTIWRLSLEISISMRPSRSTSSPHRSSIEWRELDTASNSGKRKPCRPSGSVARLTSEARSIDLCFTDNPGANGGCQTVTRCPARAERASPCRRNRRRPTSG